MYTLNVSFSQLSICQRSKLMRLWLLLRARVVLLLSPEPKSPSTESAPRAVELPALQSSAPLLKFCVSTVSDGVLPSGWPGSQAWYPEPP